MGIYLIVKPFSTGAIWELAFLKNENRLGKTGAEWATPQIMTIEFLRTRKNSNISKRINII